MLSVLMSRSPVKSGLLAASLVLPLLSGCSALGIPDGAPLDLDAAAPEALDPAATSPQPSPIEVSSKDGYTLTLPAGWVSTRTNGETTRAALAELAISDALLGAEAAELYEATGADMSMVAVDAAEMGLGPWPAVMAVLVVPTPRGSDSQQLLDDVLGGLGSVTSEIERSVTSVRAGDAQQYDLTLSGDVLTAQLRVYLFTIGDDGIVILFGSDPAFSGDSAPDMDAIIKSLRFGV